jgi:SAM-dependent methyltransferase
VGFKFSHDVYNTRAADTVVPLLVHQFSVKSVLDVGCGLGTWLSVFAKYGVNDLVGIDGDYVDLNELYIESNCFVALDLSKEFNMSRQFDMVVSLEVAEHLPKSSADKFVASLCRHGDLIVFSAAIPGQGGSGHLNEQWSEYWDEKFDRCGFNKYDIIRPLIWNDSSVDPWYRQNMYIYSRRNLCSLVRMGDIKPIIHPAMWEHKVNQLRCLRDDYNQLITGNSSSYTYLKLFAKKIINLFFAILFYRFI